MNNNKLNAYERHRNQFNVMRLIQKSAHKGAAQKLNLSLGKINYCLSALKKRGTLK